MGKTIFRSFRNKLTYPDEVMVSPPPPRPSKSWNHTHARDHLLVAFLKRCKSSLDC